jgi:hypothetical protein
MTGSIEAQNGSDCQRFIRKHWTAFAVFVLAAISALAAVVYVFIWFTGIAQTVGIVPLTLSLWSMDNVVMFILHAIFWELVLIGIPVAIGAVVGWIWWRRLPQEEKQQYHLSGKGSKGRDAGGVISHLLFIAFAIKVYIDGNWNTAIASFSLDYVVGSMVTILLWVIAIFTIPSIIALIWWISRGRTKQL